MQIIRIGDSERQASLFFKGESPADEIQAQSAAQVRRGKRKFAIFRSKPCVKESEQKCG